MGFLGGVLSPEMGVEGGQGKGLQLGKVSP